MTNGLALACPSSASHVCVAVFHCRLFNAYVSQLVRSTGACFAYDQFLNRSGLMVGRLMLQEFRRSRFGSAFITFCGRLNDLVYQCGLSLGKMFSDVFHTHCWTVLCTLILVMGCSVCHIRMCDSGQMWPLGDGGASTYGMSRGHACKIFNCVLISRAVRLITVCYLHVLISLDRSVLS